MSSTIAKTIGIRIAKLCKKKKLSQKDLADKCGLTESAISRYINGERLARIDILIKIADELEVPIQYLVLGTE